MVSRAPFRAGFPGLVDFAQRTSPVLLVGRVSPPPPDTPVNVARDAWPEWMSDDDELFVRLRGGDRIVVEGGVDEPTDLRDAPPGVSPDALAYYLPYHLYKPWGIYLRAAGISWLGRNLKGAPLYRTDGQFIEVAKAMLLAHEHYHCVIETSATRAEFGAGHPAYRRYCSDGSARLHEEALANAYAFSRIRGKHPRHAERLRDFMRLQPAGYCDFERWIGQSRFERGRGDAAQHILRQLPAGALARPPVGGEFLVAGVPPSRIPVYVHVERTSGIDVLKPFPPAEGMRIQVHTRDHQPPHVHVQMPVGVERGSLKWTSLEPVRDTQPLSNEERRRVDRYLARYGVGINRKVNTVFGTATVVQAGTT